MNAQIDSARAHPAAVISLVVAGLAVTACALVAIAYMLGWVPAVPQLPSSPTSMASPGQQVAGSAPDVALLPGETLVAPADAPAAAALASAAPERVKPAPPATPQPTKPKYTKSAPPEPAKSSPAPRNALAPIYAQPAPSSPSTDAPVLPSRAAPSRPNYTRSELAASTSYEPSNRSVCVNCGVIASIGSSGYDWEVRVRFEDGASETLRYRDRPPLRIGEHVHLEDGRILPD
jgi:hypothetical protein